MKRDRNLFTWLHLSDIHFKQDDVDYKLNQSQIWDKLRDDLKEMFEEQYATRLNAIFVTGDLAHSGKPQQYAEATERLEALAKEFGISKREIYMVPGNHDVERDSVPDAELSNTPFRGLRHGVNSLDRLLDQGAGADSWLRARQANYLACAKHFMGTDELYWSRRFTHEQLRLRIVGLNTALLAHDNEDKGLLRLGKTQLGLLSNSEKEFVIVLMHHPLSWLGDNESIQPVLSQNAHVHLIGHVHLPSSQRMQVGHGPGWIEVQAGAVHYEKDKKQTDEKSGQSRPVDHSYSMGSIGFQSPEEPLTLTIYPRRWSARWGEFRPDPDNTGAFKHWARYVLDGVQAKKFMENQRAIFRTQPKSEGKYQVFGEKQLEMLQDAIDGDTQRRLDKAERFRKSVVKRFGSLFDLEDDKTSRHPLLVDLEDMLGSLVPGIILNESEGELRRAETRHAILRTETLRAILQKVPESELRPTARGIGRSAANDLVTKVLKLKGYVPENGAAFVALWDFWDRTGGWGKIRLLGDQEKAKVLDSVPGRDLDKNSKPKRMAKWVLRVENNFLEVPVSRGPFESVTAELNAEIRARNSTHSLNEFWCGYIHGFLEVALPEIRAMMWSSENKIDQLVFIPPFIKIEDKDGVNHLAAGDVSLKNDNFEVNFVSELQSPAINILSHAARELQENTRLSAHLSADAVRTVLRDFSEKSQSRLDELQRENPVRFERILRMRDSQDYDGEKAMEYLNDANWLISELSKPIV